MLSLFRQLSSGGVHEPVPNCLQFRGRLVSNYALLEPDSITLIDGGFLTFTPKKIAESLRSVGRDISEVKTILLTHGHIDHTLNIERLRELSGASVFAPELDREIISGNYSYRGVTRIGGASERLARNVFRYRRPHVHEWFSPGAEIPVWGGLETIPLPGHTPGHVGYYSPSRKFFFVGDLFSNYRRRAKIPPPWFTVDSEMARQSVTRAVTLDSSGGVFLNHGFPGSPGEHHRSLISLASELRKRLSSQ